MILMGTLADLLGTSDQTLRMTEKQQRVLRAAAKRDLRDPATTKAEIAEEAECDPTYIDHVLTKATWDIIEYYREKEGVEIEEEPPTPQSSGKEKPPEINQVENGEAEGGTDQYVWTESSSFLMKHNGVPLLVEVSIPRNLVEEEVSKRVKHLF